MKKVLFVCLGNICRSPAAEGVFRQLVMDAGLQDKIKIDSCGTTGHHKGEPADIRMQTHAKERGYELTSVARGLERSDLEEFDYIITMDNSNYTNVVALTADDLKYKIKKMMDFASNHPHDQVPDPYYGGPDGFELVLDLLEDACSGLLEEIKKEMQN